MLIQLFDADKKPFIASDGIMNINSRKNITAQVIERNAKFAKNFPHKIAHFWAESTLMTPIRYKQDFIGSIHSI